LGEILWVPRAQTSSGEETSTDAPKNAKKRIPEGSLLLRTGREGVRLQTGCGADVGRGT